MHWHTGRYIRLIWCCIYRTAHVTTCTALRTVCIDGWNVLSSMNVLDLKERKKERTCENQLLASNLIWKFQSPTSVWCYAFKKTSSHYAFAHKILANFHQGDAGQFKKFQIYGERKENELAWQCYIPTWIFHALFDDGSKGISASPSNWINCLLLILFIIVFIAVRSFNVMKISYGAVNNAGINKNGNATGKDGVKVSSLLWIVLFEQFN